MRLTVQRANPAGNITLFVLDPVPKENWVRTASRLMALPGSDVEQVGFVCPPLPGGTGRRLEMAGGEFCGNAARAFGMLLAHEMGDLPQVRVEVSGCRQPVTVNVDWSAGTAQAQMPLPQSVEQTQVDGHPGTLVHLGGIVHLVVENIPPSLEFFQRAEPVLKRITGPEAYGVIFLDPSGNTLTPLVKVPSAGTLMWEGSCGSGSLAAAIAQSRDLPGGVFLRDYVQPAGVIQASVTRSGGMAVSASIGGPVTLDPPVVVEL